MDVEKLFKDYDKWKRDMEILKFELSRFEGVPYDDVMCCITVLLPAQRLNPRRMRNSGRCKQKH